MTESVHLDDLLTNEQAAKLLGIKPTTLEIWRTKGKSPPFLKLGTSKQAPIRYHRAALAVWLNERSFASTSAYASAEKSGRDEEVGRAVACSQIAVIPGGARRD
ncbi:helix-turn-helix domain-containing protein [Sphingomonas xanthus]|uniref:Helix-turn-helix domain-containing protein n=1 Tax=Sphingomonas xanthus TaxID=2594473 RepID=A0A516ISZ0_9SPHN|nr:helix-turn-helix domain-containing protein [Sphingomonas xanthus]QDP20023.1 helix-turn-helix domain-containing protein [Sphingomonas xanthus]